MRKETRFLSISLSNVETLSKAEQANVQGGNNPAIIGTVGCPPPIGIPTIKS